MTKKRAQQAKHLLAAVAERIEIVAIDGGGYAVTAYWITGGQKLFYDFAALRRHIGLAE